jgi:hypothetical protein
MGRPAGRSRGRPAPPVVRGRKGRDRGHGGATCDPRAIVSGRPWSRTGQSWSPDGCRHELAELAFALVGALEPSSTLVVRGRVELPTFRFSGFKDDSPGLAMLVSRPARSPAVACGGPTYTNMYETRSETTNLSGPGAPRSVAPLGQRTGDTPVLDSVWVVLPADLEVRSVPGKRANAPGSGRRSFHGPVPGIQASPGGYVTVSYGAFPGRRAESRRSRCSRQL